MRPEDFLQGGGFSVDSFAPEGFETSVERRAKFNAEQVGYDKETSKSFGRRFLSALPGQTAKALFQNPAKFVSSAVLSPVDIGRGLVGKKPVNANIPFVGKTFQAEAGKRADEIIEGNKPLFTALTPFAEVPLAGAEAIGVGKGGKQIVDKSLSFLKNRQNVKQIKNALAVTKPELSTKEQVKAFEQGRGYKSLFKRKVDVTASDRDLDVAEAAAGIVKKGDNEFKNIARLKGAIQESTDKVRAGLGNSDAIWNKNELTSAIRKVKIPITVKSDRTLSNQALNLEKALLELAEQQDKKTVGLLDLRQKFDDLINKEFPNLYDKELTPMRLYIRQLRQSVNQLTESKLPDGTLPDGTKLLDEWRRASLLIEATENIAEKAPKVGTTAVKRFGQRHPFIKATAGQAGNVAIGAGVGLGLYKLSGD